MGNQDRERPPPERPDSLAAPCGPGSPGRAQAAGSAEQGGVVGHRVAESGHPAATVHWSTSCTESGPTPLCSALTASAIVFVPLVFKKPCGLTNSLCEPMFATYWPVFQP